MKAQDLEFVAALVQVRSGLVLSGERGFYAETRLGPLARREGLPSVADLIEAVRSGRDERLLRAVVEAMLNQDTAFFRDREAFAVLSDHALPAAAASRSGALRVWSAGCGPGQEPYSLAMLAEEDPRLAGLDVFASDLSSAALEKGESGLYTHFEVQRGLPIRRLLRHFQAVGDGWRVREPLRQRVRWRRLNLVDPFSADEPFDVVLCRHLLDSFAPEPRRRALEALSAALAPDGWLVLGPDDAPPEGYAAHGAGLFRRKLSAVAAA